MKNYGNLLDGSAIGMPGGSPGGDGDPNNDIKLQALKEQVWKNNVGLIPQDQRFQYPLEQTQMGADGRGELQGVLNSYMPSQNGLSHFDEKNGEAIDNGKYSELINKGLWKILLKDKKDIDENDVNFINSVNKFIARPQIPESETGIGKNRYYFDPVTYLANKGVLNASKRGTGGELIRR